MAENKVVESGDPGERLLRQMKAKFPPKYKKTSAPKGQKPIKKSDSIVSEKMEKPKRKKKTKKVKKIEPDVEEDGGVESCGSSSGSTSPSSLTLTSSQDSGHASNTDSASRDSAEEKVKTGESSPETQQKIFRSKDRLSATKLSCRVAFFEDAIKVASSTKTSTGQIEEKMPSRARKEADFLRAVGNTPIRARSPSPNRARIDSSDASIGFMDEPPVDPVLEEPKVGTLFLCWNYAGIRGVRRRQK
jgi:hypothetical protein